MYRRPTLEAESFSLVGIVPTLDLLLLFLAVLLVRGAAGPSTTRAVPMKLPVAQGVGVATGNGAATLRLRVEVDGSVHVEDSPAATEIAAAVKSFHANHPNGRVQIRVASGTRYDDVLDLHVKCYDVGVRDVQMLFWPKSKSAEGAQ